jgi:hypothetical protein
VLTVKANSSRVRLPFLAVAVGAAMSGCDSKSASSAAVDLLDSAGVAIVLSSEARWGEGEAWVVSSEPHVTIGVLDGPAEYQFSRIADAARQSDGDVVVVDGRTREVRLYRRDGKFVRTLGGPGSGPGEFQNPAQVLVTGGDSVIVWDNANYRITRFDSAGVFASVQSVDRGAIARMVDPPLYPATAELVRDGEILVRLVEKAAKSFQPGRSRARSGALRVSADLSRIDTLMFFGDIEGVSVSAPWGQWTVVPPLAKGTLTAVHAATSRACIGDQEKPEIICFEADASRTVISWTSEVAPVTEQDVATWRDTTLGLYTQKMSENDALQVLAQVPVPTVRPPFARLALDRVGNLWVERGPAKSATPVAVDHLVFDRTGALLGVVATPPIEILEIGDDYIMGIDRDEFGVEYLQVYEIVKPMAFE